MLHPPESTADELAVPRWAKVGAGVLGAVLVLIFTFTVWEPIQVLPREGLAPGYALVDQHGAPFTSESARGSLTLYTFTPVDCGVRCAEVDATMAEVRDRVATEVDLGEVSFQAVTVGLDAGPDPEVLAAAARRSGADGEVWRWLGGDEDRIRTLVGSGFQRFYETGPDGSVERFDPGFVLVDGAGVIRGDYRYRTMAEDADRLVSHVGVLIDEIRYAKGVALVAYEAAHLFACYA